jgi:L-alanine-DL-glutamate epimerase-like enolase superfamily enzyme
MRIEAVRLHRVRIPFKGGTSFGHALSERSWSDVVFVELVDDAGGVGWGEVLPRPYVTGETIEGVMNERGPVLAERLFGRTLADRAAVEGWIREQLPAIGRDRDLAAFGGFELALLDVAGRRLGFSLADVLAGAGGGSPGPELPAGKIIGFEVATADLRKVCVGLKLGGHTHIKVKVGLDDDAERLRAIAKYLKVPLRLDANATWSVDEAVERLRAFEGVPIASIEQPVAAGDLAGMRAVHERTGIAVMADEAVCSIADAEAIVAAGAAQIFNVRPGKHGGVLGSLAIVERARAAGLGVHLGTLVGESGVLSRVAEVFGRCVNGPMRRGPSGPGFACLDGKGQNRFLLEEDVLRAPTGDARNPAVAAPLDAPGLGVDVDRAMIARHRLGEPVELRAAG